MSPSVYVHMHEAVFLGAESSFSMGLDDTVSVRVVPQVHWQIASRFRIQVGGGVSHEDGAWHPIAATRLVLE